jgi:hypothetical protein
MAFDDSPFSFDIYRERNASDVVLGSWVGPGAGRRRTLGYTLPLSHPIGPKSARVTENQVRPAGEADGRRS